MRRLAASLCSLILLTGAARADEELPQILREVGFDQRLNEQAPLDAEFRNEAGRTVRFGDCLGGKPTVLVLSYFRCPMLCTQVLNGLVEGLRGIPFDVGREFNVVTVSFDDRETPELAAAKKASYVEDYGRPGAAAGWHFLTGEQASITRLTNAVGFRYRYDRHQDQFAHASGIVILTPAGKIARYFYGIQYPARDLRLGLVEASQNKIGSPVDQVLLFCYHYDATTGKYTQDAMNLVRFAGAITILVLAAFILVSLRREWRKARTSPQVPLPAP